MDWAKDWPPGFERTLVGVEVGVPLHRARGLGRASGRGRGAALAEVSVVRG